MLLKSALKKQNPNSTEVLSGEGGGGTPRSVVYSDQSFTDTYPRQAKSIPNINFHDQGRDELEEMRGDQLQRDRPLSKSSSILEREARQMGPDVLLDNSCIDCVCLRLGVGACLRASLTCPRLWPGQQHNRQPVRRVFQ